MIDTDSTPPPQVDPPPPSPRRLVRRSDDRVIAGVCSGIAAHLGIDPLLVRIAAVVLTFAGGAGIIAYVAAWLLMPSDGGQPGTSLAPADRPQGARIAGFVLIGVAILVIGHRLWWFDGFGLPIALIAVGAWLIWGRHDRPVEASSSASAVPAAVAAPPPPPPPPLPPPPPPPTGVQPPGAAGGASAARNAATIAGGILVGLGTIGLTIAAAGSADPVTVLAIGVLAVGALMTIGSFFVRTWPLVPLGVLLLGATGLVAFVDVPLEGGFGERTENPNRVEEVASPYRLIAGELLLDLSDLALPRGSQTTIEATVAFGRIEVTAPEGVDLVLSGAAAAGQVDLLGAVAEGLHAERSVTDDDGGEGAPQLTLDLQVGTGEIKVTREP